MVAVDLNGLMVRNQSTPDDYNSFVSSDMDSGYLNAEYGTRIKYAATILCVQNKTLDIPDNHLLRNPKWFEQLAWETVAKLNWPVGLAPKKVGVFRDADHSRFCWIVEVYDKNVAMIGPGGVCADNFFQLLPNAKLAFLPQPLANSISELMSIK